MPDFVLELELGQDRGQIIIGIDEAGRAPLAGPVVAGAVWLDPDRLDPALATTGPARGARPASSMPIMICPLS